MRRAAFDGAFLFVEGESDDRLYGSFTDYTTCQIVIAFTRSSVIEVCRILARDGVLGFVGVIDADFDNIGGVAPAIPNVFRTDLHDAECQLLLSPAFERLIEQFASREKYDRWVAVNGPDLREHLLTEAAKIGCLLAHSIKTGLSLNFDDLDAGAFVRADSLRVDEMNLVRHVKNRSMRQDISDGALLPAIFQGMSSGTDLWQLVRGHDIVTILTFAFRDTLASERALEVARPRLELCLRMAYAVEDFRLTHLFSEIRRWEQCNPPYRIWRV